MAMQYIKGSDLAQLLDEYRADGEFMTGDEILRIMREAGLGLDYVHRQGIIHRDIKPSNIMLKDDGTAIIADFGLVLLSDVGTRGEIFGTPHYMSPEQAVSSAKVVPQSDIYSMGVILYEMFTHRLPFENGELLDIAMAHMSEEPPPPSTYRADLPEAIEEVILKALAKSPEDRYQTCEDLSNALAAALQQTQSTRPKTPMPRHSVVERVQLDLKENPLPPIPPSATAIPIPTAKTAEPEHTQVSLSTLSALAASSAPATSEAEVTAPSAKQAERNRWLMPLAAAGIIGIVALLVAIYAIRSDDLSDVEATGTAVVITNQALVVALTNTALPAGAFQETQTASVNTTSAAAEMTNSPLTQQASAIQATTNAVNATNAAVVNQQATTAAQPTQPPTAAVQPTQTATVAATDAIQSAGSLTGSASGTGAVQSTAAITGPAIVLMIYTEGDNALRILRPAGEVSNPLDLTPLLLIRVDDDVRLRDTDPDNDPPIARQLSGAVWSGQSPLADNECINALKNNTITALVSGNPCTDKGTYYAADYENQAWSKEFNVYYDGTFVGTCVNGENCRIEIPISG